MLSGQICDFHEHRIIHWDVAILKWSSKVMGFLLAMMKSRATYLPVPSCDIVYFDVRRAWPLLGDDRQYANLKARLTKAYVDSSQIEKLIQECLGEDKIYTVYPW